MHNPLFYFYFLAFLTIGNAYGMEKPNTNGSRHTPMPPLHQDEQCERRINFLRGYITNSLSSGGAEEARGASVELLSLLTGRGEDTAQAFANLGMAHRQLGNHLSAVRLSIKAWYAKDREGQFSLKDEDRKRVETFLRLYYPALRPPLALETTSAGDGEKENAVVKCSSNKGTIQFLLNPPLSQEKKRPYSALQSSKERGSKERSPHLLMEPPPHKKRRTECNNEKEKK